MKEFFRRVFHPTPQTDRTDTSLRYTDILFGFVIKELFVRLQAWSTLSCDRRLQLITGTALVLGSWIGFRRSVNRPAYQVKFFNLPFFRFLFDQMMLIVYFRVATLIGDPDKHLSSLSPDKLAERTTFLLVVVFFLYLLWDFLGIRTAKARHPEKPGLPLYPGIDEVTREPQPDQEQTVDWPAMRITGVFFVGVLAVWITAHCLIAHAVFSLDIVLLLFYRWVKEIRTTWRLSSKAKPAARGPAIQH
jgi:hypothetical protein